MHKWIAPLLLATASLSPANANSPDAPIPAAETTLATALTAQTPAIRKLLQDAMAEQHLPGLVFGVVADGRLVHLETLGVEDQERKRPIGADSRFRIASMTKAVTALSILTLRDQDRLKLDDPVARHIPEMASWQPSTPDGRPITISDLLHHNAGFVTDDPWGDRQQPLPETDFSRMLAAGVPFHRPTGTGFDYSNLGYAMLGRVIANASGTPYADYVQRTILTPLGMASTGYDLEARPPATRTRGYRFENDRFQPEPDMGPGAFQSMGGLITTANDYARWIALLLSGWPAGSEKAGPIPAATLRDMLKGSGFPQARPRPGRSLAECRLAATYGMGLIVAQDCELGLVAFHGGGYPGYGSHMLLLPEAGIGFFAFANRTYAPVSVPVWDAALLLHKAGGIQPGPIPVSPALAEAYKAAGDIYAAGRIDVDADMLAMNMLLDRSAANWRQELARLKQEAGSCETGAPIQPDGALSGRFRWQCDKALVEGRLLLAPTPRPAIQSLQLAIRK